MKTFHNIEEMKPYYNVTTNTYEFVKNGSRMNVKFEFNLSVNSHIKAGDIKAFDIKALEINACDITYYAYCLAYYNIKCTSIHGTRPNARHFVLDGEITITPKQEKKPVTLELTDEQLAKIKPILEENK